MFSCPAEAHEVEDKHLGSHFQNIHACVIPAGGEAGMAVMNKARSVYSHEIPLLYFIGNNTHHMPMSLYEVNTPVTDFLKSGRCSDSHL